MFKVEKKDGQIVDFDRTKITRGLTLGGATIEQAESVATQIETWLPTVAVGGIVKSVAIRGKLLAILDTTFPAVAATFRAYQKPAG